MRESLGVAKPKGRMKVKALVRELTEDVWCLLLYRRWPDRTPGASHPLTSERRTESAHVGTRKMVNYAWEGRSQRKLWWRSVSILTCKSIVEPWYRGERLIELSSSWFPPKFPSG